MGGGGGGKSSGEWVPIIRLEGSMVVMGGLLSDLSRGTSEHGNEDPVTATDCERMASRKKQSVQCTEEVCSTLTLMGMMGRGPDVLRAYSHWIKRICCGGRYQLAMTRSH